MLSRSASRSAFAGLLALALGLSAVGPCHCFLGTAACHQETQESDGHGCCEKPAGVQAVSGECCDSGPVLVLASTEVPEVTPPTLQDGPLGSVLPAERSVPVDVFRMLPPPPLDRTTVLLI